MYFKKNTMILTVSVNIIVFLCGACKSTVGMPEAHPTQTATPSAKRNNTQSKPALVSKEKPKDKKPPSKPVVKVELDSSNQELLDLVSAELKIKKNTSINLAGNGDKQEICFVKIDTLETQNKIQKLEITLSEMVDGKEIALQFTLFSSANGETLVSEVMGSNIKSKSIQIEQKEKKAEAFHLHKKLVVDVSEANKKANYIIEDFTTHSKKQCSVPFQKQD